MYGEMVLDSFNLNWPNMINFRPIIIIRKEKKHFHVKGSLPYFIFVTMRLYLNINRH